MYYITYVLYYIKYTLYYITYALYYIIYIMCYIKFPNKFSYTYVKLLESTTTFFYLSHFAEHVKWSKKGRKRKKLYLKTFDDRFFGRQSSNWQFFYEYKKVWMSSTTLFFIIHLSEHFTKKIRLRFSRQQVFYF